MEVLISTWYSYLKKHKNIRYLFCQPILQKLIYSYMYYLIEILRDFSKPLKIFFGSVYLNNWWVKSTEADHSVNINIFTRNTLFKEKIDIA